MSDAHHVPMPPIMPESIGRLTGLAQFVVPACLFAAIGLEVGNTYTALAAVIVWSGAFFAQNYVEVEAMTFVVINQLGYHRTVKFGGPRFIFTWLDRITRIGDLRTHSMELFRDANGELEPFDFFDGSAPVLAKAWWQAASPEAVARRDWRTVREQIVRFVYRLDEKERLALTKEVFQSVLRSVLEPNTMRAAQDKSKDLIKDATVIIREILAEVGVFPDSTNGITLLGLELTEEQRHLRMEGMRGEAEAARAVNRAPAYYKPLIEMIKHCKEAEIDLESNEIIRNFLTQKIIEALPHLKGSVNLVGADLERIIGMLSLAGAAGVASRSTP